MSESYDLFLCHVSRLDGRLAVRLKDGLEQFSEVAADRPKRRKLKVFLDQDSVGAGSLPNQIRLAVSSSRFLVVVLRPELAARPWCVEEISIWLEHQQDSARLLLLQSDGSNLRWNEGLLQFSDHAQPLPALLQHAFAVEPSWIDLRSLQGKRNDDWWMRLGKLAAPVFETDPEALWNRQLIRQKRALVKARAAIFALLILVATLCATVYAAITAREEARLQARATQQRGLAAQALLRLQTDPVAASETIIEAHAADPSSPSAELRSALSEVVQRARLVKRLEPPMGSFGSIRTLSWSSDFERLLIAGDEMALIVDREGFARSNTIRGSDRALMANASCALESPGFALAFGHRDSQKVTGGLMQVDVDGRPLGSLAFNDEPLSLVCRDGEILVGTDKGEVLRVSRDFREWTVEQTVDPPQPINALVWEQHDPAPAAIRGEVSRGSAGHTLQIEQWRDERLGVLEPSAQQGNALAAALLGSDVAIATQAGSIQLLRENLGGIGWTPDPALAFNGHVGPVWALVVANEALISAGADQRIRVWNRNGSVLIDLPGHRSEVTALAFDHRENKLFSGDRKGDVLVWSLPELAEPAASAMPMAWDHASRTYVERDEWTVDGLPDASDPFQKLQAHEQVLYWQDGSPDVQKPLQVFRKTSDRIEATEVALQSDYPVSVLPLANNRALIGGGYASGLLGLKSVEAAMRAFAADTPALAQPDANAIGLYLFQGSQLVKSTKSAHYDSILALAACGSCGEYAYASGGADGRIHVWDAHLNKRKSMTLFSDVDSTVVTALRFSDDRRRLLVGVKTDAMQLGSERGWLLAFDLETGDIDWRQDLHRAIPNAILAAADGTSVFRTARPTSPLDPEPIEQLWAIEDDGRGLRPLTGELLSPAIALGVDSEDRLQIADEKGRRFSIALGVGAQILEIESRTRFHRTHSKATEHAARAERAWAAGDRQTAIAEMREGLQCEPQSTGLRMRLAAWLMNHVDTLPEAILIYDSVVEDMPRMSIPRYQRGKALLYSSRFAEAESDFSVALEVGSEVFGPNRPIRMGDGGLAQFNQLIAEALEKLGQAPHLELLELRAVARMQQGKRTLALEDASAAIAGGRKTERLDEIVRQSQHLR